jgi:hypothetical protein
MGQLVAAGALRQDDVFAVLAAAAAAAGLGETEAASTIRSGLAAGIAKPRPLLAIGGRA